jgi:uncharacterized iron-regulated protein
MFLTEKIAFYCFLTVLILSLPGVVSALPPVAPEPDYQLAISFDLDKKELTGTARIASGAGETLSLFTSQLKITGILLKRQDGSSNEIKVPDGPVFTLPSENVARELFISYTATTVSNGENLISPAGITLLDNWYPTPDRPMHYQLTATLPDTFIAVTESDSFPLRQDGSTVTASFSEAAMVIHFAAAPYVLSSIEARDGLKVHALFFPEDAHLATEYLEKSKEYLNRYENEIGPFPYNHYVIVANRLPTGLGMPTFTLLGQSVLRLPFIKDTSLGHEILHSWFGNSIDVDTTQGNWCEGLTAYLSDHLYRRDKGDDAAYRKESIVNYHSYVNTETVIPLAQFRSGSHAQPGAKARRAVGYSRAMLLFHELHERVEAPLFEKALRNFYLRFKGKTASWHDLQTLFNETSTEDLSAFFSERLSRTDIPAFHVTDISTFLQGDRNILKFTIQQETEKPYSLQIPVSVTTGLGQQRYTLHTDSKEKVITLHLSGRPLEFTLDPDYSLLRKLNAEETPATWSRFMGSAQKLVVIESEEARVRFQPLLDQLASESVAITSAEDLRNAELRDVDLLILGQDQSASSTLFGEPDHPKNGFTLDVRHNPLNQNHVAVLISSDSSEETAAAFPRLSHYGKYAYLHFQRGSITEKRNSVSESGQRYVFEQLPFGSSTQPLRDFNAIARELSLNSVIYIGENHTSASDHRLQLRLIEAIARLVPDLAIGMEMFPESSQQSLDEYVLNVTQMTEKEFLKSSGYYTVWKYDFRYFQDIFSFVKKNDIPVIGLNLDRAIVSSVYATGGTDDLSQEIRDSLPQQRNLDMEGYSRRLQAMHSMHEEGSHGSGKASGFIQAQALWDETMAENIAVHLRAHPGRKMIVLAGAQHTRKDSGIPPRVARRIDVQQASVLNILNGSSPTNLHAVADYFFLSEPLELEDPPKMGIVLQEHATAEKKYVEITEFTPHSKAVEAGLRTGDVLLTIGGYPIESMEDIRISMFDAEQGDNIIVTVERAEENITKTLQFSIELVTLPTEMPGMQHP